MYHKIGLHDTCGIHNLHGLPGLIGGWVSAMVIASYQTSPGLDSAYQTLFTVAIGNRSLSQQAGIQIACSFIALGIGLGMGVLCGFFIYSFYDWKDE